MVWVVYGRRLTRDFPRFIKEHKFSPTELKPGIMNVDFADEYFPRNWLKNSVPVLFDFLSIDNPEGINTKRQSLYSLFPSHDDFEAVFAIIPRKTFIKTVLNGEWNRRIQAFMDEMEEQHREKGKER